jgi:hypothetical protein
MSTEPPTPTRPLPDLDGPARDLGDVEVALRRMDEGSHGTCEACGKELGTDIMVAFPAARRCSAHGGPASAPPASGRAS